MGPEDNVDVPVGKSQGGALVLLPDDQLKRGGEIRSGVGRGYIHRAFDRSTGRNFDCVEMVLEYQVAVDTDWVAETKYMMFVDGSITGVLKIPGRSTRKYSDRFEYIEA